MKIIGICGPAPSPGRQATFDALGQALGCRFEQRTFGDDRNLDGWVVLGADRSVVAQLAQTTLRCYVVFEHELMPCGTSSTVRFSNRSEVPTVLKGRELTAEDVTAAQALPSWLADLTPLALKDELVLWATQDRSKSGNHLVALPPPELNPGEPLFVHFSGKRLACLLPLVVFLRSLTADPHWEAPPLQAAFMFDDPNLHSGSYGFVEYRRILDRASAGNYHVSFATIPLDAWFVHRPTSLLFKKNASRLSLLYHGNDHVSNELARSKSPDAMRSLLIQALGRIEHMEARTGLEVARVMAPPHGACSETAISEMAGLGFDAVCVSRGSLRFHNPSAKWTKTIGMRPCDNVARLSVIPRFGLAADCRNDVIIAALLHQPIVPMTHHQALADGYDLLDATAALINSLGYVLWRDLKAMSRSLYSHNEDGTRLHVRMWSRRVSVSVPAGVTQLHVERPWTDDAMQEPIFWRDAIGPSPWHAVACPAQPITVGSGATVEIASGTAEVNRTPRQGGGPRRLGPVARRLLTEVRDRALPSMHSLRGRWSVRA